MIKECEKQLKIPIGPDKIQNEHSTLGQAQPKLDLAAPQPKQHGGFMYGFALIIVLLMVFIGFQIYGSLTESSARFKPDDYAPQDNYRLLEEQREAFKTEIEKETMAMEDDLGGKNASEHKVEIETNAVAYLPEAENKKETDYKEISSKSDLTDMQPSGLVSDQRSVIYFEHNSNDIPQKAYETLNNIIKLTSRLSDLRITVEGFTDSHGDPVYNKQLSKYRADMVKSYLIGKGVSASKIDSIGRGSQNPLKSNASLDGRIQNRRVEIKINPE